LSGKQSPGRRHAASVGDSPCRSKARPVHHRRVARHGLAMRCVPREDGAQHRPSPARPQRRIRGFPGTIPTPPPKTSYEGSGGRVPSSRVARRSRVGMRFARTAAHSSPPPPHGVNSCVNKRVFFFFWRQSRDEVATPGHQAFRPTHSVTTRGTCVVSKYAIPIERSRNPQSSGSLPPLRHEGEMVRPTRLHHRKFGMSMSRAGLAGEWA